MSVFNVYGWTGYDKEAQTEEGKLLYEIQEEVGRLGDTPWLAGGDWNRTPSEMAEHWAGIGTVCCAGFPPNRGVGN